MSKKCSCSPIIVRRRENIIRFLASIERASGDSCCVWEFYFIQRWRGMLTLRNVLKMRWTCVLHRAHSLFICRGRNSWIKLVDVPVINCRNEEHCWHCSPFFQRKKNFYLSFSSSNNKSGSIYVFILQQVIQLNRLWSCNTTVVHFQWYQQKRKHISIKTTTTTARQKKEKKTRTKPLNCAYCNDFFLAPSDLFCTIFFWIVCKKETYKPPNWMQKHGNSAQLLKHIVFFFRSCRIRLDFGWIADGKMGCRHIHIVASFQV